MRNRGCGSELAVFIGSFSSFVLVHLLQTSTAFQGEYVKYSIQGTKIFENSHLKTLAQVYVVKFCFTLRFHFTFRKAFLFATTSFYNFPPDFPPRIPVKQQRRRKLVTLNGILL